MEQDIEEELRPLDPKQGLEKDEMARAADGQKLGYPLHKTKKDCLEETDCGLLILRKNIMGSIVTKYSAVQNTCLLKKYHTGPEESTAR